MRITGPYFCSKSFLILNMSEMVFLVEEAIEGGYNARAIGEAIFTQGDTLHQLEINIADSIKCHYGDVSPEFELRFDNNL